MTSYGGYVLETFVTLVLVCALAFALLYGAKRLGVGRASGAIELVGQLPLEARRAIYLVKVGAQIFVVGVGEGGFTKLGEFAATDLPPRAPEASFPALLARALKRETRSEKIES